MPTTQDGYLWTWNNAESRGVWTAPGSVGSTNFDTHYVIKDTTAAQQMSAPLYATELRASGQIYEGGQPLSQRYQPLGSYAPAGSYVNSFNGRSGTVSLASSDVTNALGYTPESLSNKGVANGYASLGSDGKVPASQIAAGGGSQWATSGSSIYYNAGYVGIGTTAPASRLDIGGKLRLFDATPTSASIYTDCGYTFGSNIPSGSVTEVSGEILSYAINVPQIGPRNSSRVGAIFRLDTRNPVNNPGLLNGEQSFIVFGHPAGTNNELSRIVVSLQTGDTLITPNGGRVGIANTSPQYALDVGGTINAIDVKIQGTSLSSSASYWKPASPGASIWFDTTTSGGSYVGINTSTPSYYLDVAGSFRAGYARISQVAGFAAPLLIVDGKIAVGQTSATYEVDVVGTVNASAFRINGALLSNNPSQWVTSGQNIYFNAAYTGYGNVGIHKTNPAYELDVAGVVNADYFYVNGSPLSITQWTSIPNSTYIYYNSRVRVGSTASPIHMLDVAGEVNATGFRINGTPITNAESNWTSIPGTDRDITSSGAWSRVGINLTPSYELDVNGTMRATTIRATTFYLNGNAMSTGTFSQWVNNPPNKIYYYGSVGINITAPAYDLDVAGTINASQILKNGVPLSNGSTQWTTGTTNTTTGLTPIYYRSGGVGFSLNSSFVPSGSYAIETDGYVKALAYIFNNGSQQDYAADMWFRNSPNANYIRLAADRVGILANAPAYPLDVGGIIRSSSGGFRFPDGTTQTTAASSLGYTPVNKAGDSMTGTLSVGGVSTVNQTTAGLTVRSTLANKFLFLGYRSDVGSYGVGVIGAVDNNIGFMSLVIDPNGAGIYLGGYSLPASGRYLDTSTGGYLSSGGVWTNASSRALKNIVAVPNALDVLKRVESLNLYEYTYKAQPQGAHHLTPMAEEFFGLFGLGDAASLSAADVAGIALVAIKGLTARVRDLEHKQAGAPKTTPAH